MRKDTFWSFNYKGASIQGHFEYPENDESREVINIVMHNPWLCQDVKSIHAAKCLITRHLKAR